VNNLRASISRAASLIGILPAVIIAVMIALMIEAPFTSDASAQTSQPAFKVPANSNPVVDLANAVDPRDETTLNRGLKQLYVDSGIQVGVLAIDSTNGLPIEQASISVAEQWKLGKEKSDQGVLLLVAIADRAVRIEVGQGLEGQITDAHAKRLIDQLILPRFREGEISKGIVTGVTGIVRLAAPEIDPGTYLGRRTGRALPMNLNGGGFHFSPGLLIFIIFIAIKIMLAFSRYSGGSTFGGYSHRRRGRWDWGGGSGGGWGGGSSSGGGWSGGGGGFSGGGASGRW